MRVWSPVHGFWRSLNSKGWIWVAGFLALLAPPALAQVAPYSIDVKPGYNSIANHLSRNGNRLDEIIPNVPNGTLLFKWNPATQNYYSPAQHLDGRWFSQEQEMEYLSPGEGAFLHVNRDLTLTFSGDPIQINLPRPVALGYNFVSAQQPRAMNFAEVFGFPPQPGDLVYLFENPFTDDPRLIEQNASSTHKFTPQGWDTAPSFGRGRSAFVFLGDSPRILVQPKPQMANAGDTVRLDVSALGAPPLRYQWFLNDDELPRETNSFLQFSKAHFLDTGSYSVSVINARGEALSRAVTVRIISPPVILDPPIPIRTTPGRPVSFRVKAVGTPFLRYQWFRDNQLLPNATAPILEFNADRTAQYHVGVMNDLGAVQTQPVLLEVHDPPIITKQPVSQRVRPDTPVTFFVEATGTPPLTYHWRHNGQRIPSGTNQILTIPKVQPHHAGTYDVVVANSVGAAHSDRVLLSLDVPRIFLTDRINDSLLFSEPEFLGVGDNLNATRDEQEPYHCGRFGTNSVWMRWLPKDRGIVQFDTSGSGFDTVLAAYTEDASGQLMEVACDDDSGTPFGSLMRFAAMPDTIYYIAIDGVDGAQGEIVLQWQLQTTPELLPIIVQQPRDQTARPGADDVVFSVLVAGDPTGFQWYHNGVLIQGANEPTLRLPRITEADLGFYFVDIFQGRQVVRSRRALLQSSLADMDNVLLEAFAFDHFKDAVVRMPGQGPFGGGLHSLAATAFTPVLGYTGTQIFSTVGFGGEPGELSHCGIPGGASAWFVFIPAADGQLHLNTEGSSFNTVLAVYTGPGPTLASLTAVACDNNSGAGTTSSLNFPAKKDTIYYIAVDGLNGVTGNARLNYRLLVPITLTRILKTNDTLCTFRVTATRSYPFTIQRCNGLTTWLNVLTTNSPTDTFDYRDTNAVALKRYYRVTQTP